MRLLSLVFCNLTILVGLCSAQTPVPVSETEKHTPDFAIIDRIPTATVQSEGYPAIAYNPLNNEYFVALSLEYHESSIQKYSSMVYGQRISSSGNRIGDKILVGSFDSDKKGGDWEVDIAYNSVNNEYLVVWRGFYDGETHVRAQRVSAAGQKIGTQIRVTDKPAAGGLSPKSPAVAFNSINNEYLIVYNDNRAYKSGDVYLSTGHETFGQRLSANGQKISSEFRVSHYQPINSQDYRVAEFPAIAYNSINNYYFVVWMGRTPTGRSIYGRRINAATGGALENEFRVTARHDLRPTIPDITFNPARNEFFVIWGDYGHEIGTRLYGHEIYGQKFNGLNGSKIGNTPVKISNMGQPHEDYKYASYATVRYRPTHNQYLVTWLGAKWYFQPYIFGQLLHADTLAKIGVESFWVTQKEIRFGANSSYYGWEKPALAVNESSGEGFVSAFTREEGSSFYRQYGKIFTPYLVAPPTPTPTQTPQNIQETLPKGKRIHILSPQKGALYKKNMPVRFIADTSSAIVSIEIFIDGKRVKRIKKMKRDIMEKRFKLKKYSKGKHKLKVLIKYKNGKKAAQSVKFRVQ